MSTPPPDGLPPLRTVIAEAGLSARKGLGQHFLLDLNLTRRVARQAGPLADRPVLEIGPGPGGLTRALFLEGATRVLAVERDERFRPALEAIAHSAPGKLAIAWDDALAVDERELLRAAFGEASDALIAANLPYNVATALVVKWVLADPWPSWWSQATLMVQREVAERMAARPGTKTYGRLSVLLALRAPARLAFDVAPSAFVPPPKVQSTVVVLTPRDGETAPDAATIARVERITAAAFGQRRKMLRQSLKSVFPNPEASLETVGVAPTARAETVAPETYLQLAQLPADHR
jgi:16S rRNA (adenine1518-N6/adenine1519-N6)-dimethyltransferase